MNRWLSYGIVLVGASSCSKPAGHTGGLLLRMTTDGSFAATLTTLRIVLRTAGDAAPFDDAVDPVAPASFPATLGIASNGDPSASVVIDVSVWSGNQPLDARRYEVNDVPTTSVEEVDVVFSARCTPHVADIDGAAVSTCGPAMTCDPATGRCATDVYGAVDGGATGSRADAAPDAEVPPDAGADANEDAESGAPDDGGAASDASCDPDAGPQCDDNAVQQCVAGQWTSPTPCLGGLQCTQGQCQTVPPSCVNIETPPPYASPCESLEVPSGAFDRSYDGVAFVDASATASVHGFRLDAFEVNVQRFAAFTTAVGASVGADLPDAGAGKHTYLNDAKGLVVGLTDGGVVYESGWDPSWAQGIATTAADWTTNLDCQPSTFAAAASSLLVTIDADYPINCVTWYEAYAFCIWDGGFLPTEAEWNYAASGGSQQRVYPWGSMDPGMNSTYAIWGCYFGANGVCTNFDTNVDYVGQLFAGRGLWGQWDLAGNMAEWTLDAYAALYGRSCDDCTVAGPQASQRVYRGGSFGNDKTSITASARAAADPSTRSTDIGFRCARAP